MKVLVTGASGFVGQSLVKSLKLRGAWVVGVGRQLTANNADTFFSVPDFTDQLYWQKPLTGCDVVIHLAARVHILAEYPKNSLAEFRKINVEGTQCLAESAAQAGVKRFIYVSSIGVNGTRTSLPFTELDNPNPQSAYALSKWEAEQALHQVAKRTGLEIVIVRPPLVYGVNAPGNFAQMLKVLATGIPLPFLSVKNKRSFIYVDNLVDVLILCSTHPDAAGKTYLVSDDEDVSTPELLRMLGRAMGEPVRLFTCPLVLLKLVGRLTGKLDQVEKVTDSLQVDSSKIRRELGWMPPISLEDGLMRSV